MKVAIYARVSTNEQSPDMQISALNDYCKARGWSVFNQYVDIGVSGTKDRRPALDQLMDAARKRQFDTVAVWRFDRFARSTRHLLTALEEFRSLGVEFISYQENIDTASPLGKAIFVIVGAMAELERNIIVERVKSGIRTARAKGKRIGRPKGTTLDIEQAHVLQKSGLSVRAIAKQLGASKSQVAYYLASGKTPEKGMDSTTHI